MATVLRWYGDNFRNWSYDHLFEGLKAAGAMLHMISQQKASIANTGETRHRKRDTTARGGGARGTQYTVYPHSSRPGESPRMRTGFGRRNIVWGADRKRMAARVGYTRNARYMTYHELGIRYRIVGKQKRPTIIPALEDNLTLLGQIAERAATRKLR